MIRVDTKNIINRVNKKVYEGYDMMILKSK